MTRAVNSLSSMPIVCPGGRPIRSGGSPLARLVRRPEGFGARQAMIEVGIREDAPAGEGPRDAAAQSRPAPRTWPGPQRPHDDAPGGTVA